MRAPDPRARPPRSFRLLLRLLPAHLRQEYTGEMEHDLLLRFRDARRDGRRAVMRLWWGLLADVVRTLFREAPEVARLGATALRADLRTSLRNLRRNPLPAAGTALVLAVGIGLSTSVFSVAYSVLFRPMPYPEADRLVTVWDQIPYGDEAFWTPSVQAEHLEGIRESVDVLEETAAFSTGFEALTGAGDPEMVAVVSAEPRLLDLLGATAGIGRLLSEEDLDSGREVALLGHHLWKDRFGGASGILGRTVRVDEQDLTVIGVLPPAFSFPGFQAEVVRTLRLQGTGRASVIGRIAEGVTPGLARERLRAHFEARDGTAARPGTSGEGADLPLVGLKKDQVSGVKITLLALLGGSLFVLLIACANAAGLWMVRALKRGKELSTRAALGAGRARLARMLLGESLLTALAGGAGGTLLAVWLVRLFMRLEPGNIPRLEAAAVDLRVLAFALGVSVAAGVVTGLAPLVGNSMQDLLSPLKDAAGAGGRKGRRIRDALVVTELALSIVLLAGAGLMVRSLKALNDVELGFEEQDLLTWYVSLPRQRYPDAADRQAFLEELDRVLTARGEVEAASFTGSLPVGLSRGATWLQFPEDEIPPGFTGEGSIPGFASQPGTYTVNRVEVAQDYFEVIGIPILAGRLPETASGGQAHQEVLISRRMAEELWGGTEVLGATLLRGDRRATIVGVVDDLRFGDLRLDYLPTMYTPFDPGSPPSSFYILARTRVPPMEFAEEARSIVWGIDPDLPVRRMVSMEEQVAYWLAEPRFYSLLFGLFSLSALLLALAGIYGVVSYSVSQQRREIGVRMALGATRGLTLRSVLGRGVRLSLVGSVLGAAGAVAATRVIRGLLFQVEPGDPLTLAGVVVLLLAGTLVAVLLPAVRATRVDPVEALRVE